MTQIYSNLIKMLGSGEDINLISFVKGFMKLAQYTGRNVLDEFTSDFLDTGKRTDLKKDFIESISKYRSYVPTLPSIPKLLGRWKIYEVSMISQEKTAVGLAEGIFFNIFEVGLKLDNIMGFPYIPSSTIKGSIRRVYQIIYSKYRKSNPNLPHVNELFGSSNRIGAMGFSDAYPQDPRVFYPDIVTPHYGANVRGEMDVSPEPIPHVVVRKGVKFKFLAFLKPDYSKFFDTFKDINVVDIGNLKPITLGLIYALAKGVGARTSYGYSRFKVLSIEEVV